MNDTQASSAWRCILLAPLLLSSCVTDPNLVTSTTLDEEEDSHPCTVQNPAETVEDPKLSLDNFLQAEEAAPVVPGNLWDRVRLGFRLTTPNDPRIRRELDALTANPDTLESRARRAGPYLHFIVEEAERRGIPLEVALLPALESGFRPDARSPQAALGLWQIVPGTARTLGLKQNFWYEGRCDVTASTRAALDYLHKLSEMFDGDWELALAAYNAGPGTIQKAIRSNQSRGKATDFWSLRLPDETRKYVPRLLAIARILEHPDRHGISLDPIPNTPFFSQVELPGPLDLNQAADIAQVDRATLSLLNPGLRRGATGAGSPRSLLLPANRAAQFEERLAQLSTHTAEVKEHKEHKEHSPIKPVAVVAQTTPPVAADLSNKEASNVQDSDKLSRVVDQFDAPQRANELPEKNLRPEQQLRIPAEAAAPHVARQVSPKPALAEPAHAIPNDASLKPYTVQDGDTLSEIAHQFGVPQTAIQRANALTGKNLQPGQRLRIPEGEETAQIARHESQRSAIAESDRGANNRPALPPKPTMHQIRSGDTLDALAKTYHVSIEHLMEWNHLDEDDLLRPGRELRVYAMTDVIQGRTVTYQVKKGDSLDGIAQRFKVKVEDVRRWNRLSSNLLQPQQILMLHLSAALTSSL